MGLRHALSGLRRDVAEAEEIISRVFPAQRGVQIPTCSKTSGP